MLTGLIVGLIVVAIISVFIAMRPAPPIDADLGPDKISFTSADTPAETFKIAEALPVSAPNYKLGRADAGKGRVILSDGMTMSSYGYFYAVDVALAPGGSTVTVSVKSRYPLQFGPIVRKQREAARQKLVDALKAKLAGAI
jgi:hypothetical protein